MTADLVRNTSPYLVVEDGLLAMVHDKTNIAGNFRVATAVLNGAITKKLEQSPTRLLYKEFEKLGMSPDVVTFGEQMCIKIRFDVSSASNKAYYEMWTMNESRRPGEWIYAMVHLEKPDPVVMRNIDLLDQMLFILVQKCGFSQVNSR